MTEPLGLTPAPRTSLTGTVADQLAELIVNGLGPGDRLPPERELARKLEVSRIVVREAMRGLAERGLVQVKPGVGTFVVAMPASAVTRPLSLYIRRNQVGVDQLFELRSALEPAIAAAAARSASAGDLEAAEANLERTDDLVSSIERDGSGIEEFAWADLEFHQLLARASGNPLFEVVLGPLIDRQLQVRREGAGRPGAARHALDGHRGVYRAVVARDAGAAASLMGEHLQTIASLFSAADGNHAKNSDRDGKAEEFE